MSAAVVTDVPFDALGAGMAAGAGVALSIFVAFVGGLVIRRILGL